ncbi:hypothetical protein [Tenacibaculum sp. nBUS_03]|uniref:hypothetical protein n=1 Tax=Tenacibaculum sp. nBUS_03 TaxID=3395320 RepID=UPI003EB6DA67
MNVVANLSNEITYHLNQGISSVFQVYTYILIGLFVSLLISFFLQEKKNNRLIKSIIINSFFFLTVFILYQFAIETNYNISVFSRERKEEFWMIIIFIGTFIVTTYSQLIIFKNWITDKLKIQLIVTNFIFLTYLLISFYPKNYVNKKNIDYERILFIPNKDQLNLFDKKKIYIDTACTGKTYYRNNKTSNFFNFRIPLISNKSDRRKFGFEILDKKNQYGTSEDGSNCKVLPLRYISDTILVLFKQKNPDSNIGWKTPIITDTIEFTKFKIEKIKPGYYGDTNCDCIQH